MRTLSLVFDGSGTDEKTLPRGTFFLLLSTSSALSLKAYQRGSEIAEMSGSVLQQGVGWESLDEKGGLRPFDEIRINSALAQTVQIAVGFGRMVNNLLTGNVTATITKATTASDDADAVIAALGTLDIAADATRRSVTICLDPDSPSTPVRVSHTGGARGSFLQSGMALTLENTDAWKIYNPDAVNDAYVGILYEKD